MSDNSFQNREVAGHVRMNDHEALMWNVEKDPWLNSSGASLTLLDQPADFDYLRRTISSAVVKMPRLIQRVVPSFGRLATPAWAPDAEFDLDHHLQEVDLSGTGTRRDLFDLATRLYNEPLDRTRPLWRFVSINGLEDGSGAVYIIMHHVIADGIGQMRMAEMYQQLTRTEPPPPDVDLHAFIAAAVEASTTRTSGDDLVGAVRDNVAHVARRQLSLARRVAGEVVLWPADPKRMNDKLVDLGQAAAAAMNQLAPSPLDDSHGSPLWKQRSRHRHLEHVSLTVSDLKNVGRAVDASLNEVFLAGLAEGAHRYHHERDAPAQSFNSSFVLSKRSDDKAGGNAFTPVPIRLPAGPMPMLDRVRAVSAAAGAARDEAQRTGGLGALSAAANLLPTSIVTRAARAQGARIDFATSNLRGAPIELFCAGARVERTIVLGPVAATGANITAMSYLDNFEIGMFIDPEAIAEPGAFRAHVEAAFADMFSLAPAPEPAKKKKKAAPRKKPAAKKKAAPRKKPAAKKKAAPKKKPAAKKKAAPKKKR